MSLLILKEKHDTRHFLFNDENELELLAGYIIRERYDDGWYEDAEEQVTLQKALRGDLKAALRFLHLRNTYDCEYERFEIVEPETVKGLK